MEVKKFDFTFNHAGENINASCQVCKPHNKVQYRIALQEENGDDVVLVMYKVGDEKFFWFPVSAEREVLSEAVAKELEEIIIV